MGKNDDNLNLTKRESEVLRLLVAGKTNGEIAKILFITSHTVKAHVSAILKKLDCKTRVEAIIQIMSKPKTNLHQDLKQP